MPVASISSDFYDAGALKRLATNLFYGWGYNFYRAENQLRTDDLLIRAQVSDLIGQSRRRLTEIENAYRREFLPLPTRERPDPDPQAVRQAQTLKAWSQELGLIEGRIRAAPAPGTDRMWQRHREEKALLETLCAHDETLVGRCALLRDWLQPQTAEDLLAHGQEMGDMIAALHETLKARDQALQILPDHL